LEEWGVERAVEIRVIHWSIICDKSRVTRCTLAPALMNRGLIMVFVDGVSLYP
jgi:hypothetical protein